MIKLFINLIKNFVNSPLIVFILLILLFLSLQMISSATVDSQLFGRIYYFLIIINIITLILFFLLIANQSWKLYKQYKQQIPGSRLTLRMVLTFVTLVILPTTILYFFSIQFIQRSIDSWFDASVEHALKDAMNLSKAAVDDKKKAHLKEIKRLVKDLQEEKRSITVLTLSEIREKSGAEDVTLLSSRGKLLASTSEEEGEIIPDIPESELLLPLQQGSDYVHVDLSDDGYQGIRVLVRLAVNNSTEFFILQALYPLNSHQRKMAASVQQAYTEYSELVYLRNPLKYTFSLTLSLVLLLGLLSAIWAAFVFAKRLSSPIRDLAEGTRAVAEGNYHQPIPMLDSGDLGQLVESFNKMTRQLSKTHSQLEESNVHTEAQRAYLEVILRNLTSGIICLDESKKIQRLNPEASHILDIDAEQYVGFHIHDLSFSEPKLEPLVEKILTFMDGGMERWREEITLIHNTKKMIIICRANILPDKGSVIVLEDVTALIQAQKNAAWGEVARRLAHEIKNPLTPIQLSAERINHKFKRKMEKQDGETLNRLTNTIVSQVDNMKELVKAFSEYAKLPKLNIAPLQINSLIMDVLDMYRTLSDLTIKTSLDEENIYIEADSGKIRQVLHNLIKNALEAMADNSEKCLFIGLKILHNHQTVQLCVEDCGMGIKEVLLSNIFDPYVTEKSKGSGLGLAIVKKIVEEHGGTIRAENIVKDGIISGSRFIISLPIMLTN
jgi:two-component system, NtrC family, nitrogen regulation sensor histidine kinase NtrY